MNSVLGNEKKKKKKIRSDKRKKKNVDEVELPEIQHNGNAEVNSGFLQRMMKLQRKKEDGWKNG